MTVSIVTLGVGAPIFQSLLHAGNRGVAAGICIRARKNRLHTPMVRDFDAARAGSLGKVVAAVAMAAPPIILRLVVFMFVSRMIV